MVYPTPKPGDAVLVTNDFSTPEDWEYPAIVKEVDGDMASVAPLNDTYIVPTEDGTLPVFCNQCKPLLKGKAKQTYTDVAGPVEFDAYLDPDTKKLYYKDQPEPDEPISVLDDEAWFEAEDGTKYDADDLTMIGDLEDQSYKDE